MHMVYGELINIDMKGLPEHLLLWHLPYVVYSFLCPSALMIHNHPRSVHKDTLPFTLGFSDMLFRRGSICEPEGSSPLGIKKAISTFL